MKVSDFVYEMQQTAAILGRTSDTVVTFSGDQAYTDGKTINLPAMSLDKELTNEQVRMMRGYVDHEAGHHRHSDMGKIIPFYKQCVNNGKQQLKDIHNCLEDVWMEHRVVDDYPGAWKNLKQVNDTIKTMELDSFKGNIDVLKEVNTASIGGGIKAQNPLYLTEHSPSQKFLDALTPEMQEWTKMWCDQAIKAKDSSELITLAKSIYKLIQEDPNFEQNQKPEDFDPQSGEGYEVGDEGDVTDAEAMGWKEGKGKKGEEGKQMPKDHLPTMESAIDGPASDTSGGGIGGSEGPLKGGYRVYSTEDDIIYKRNTVRNAKGSKRIYDIVESNDTATYSEVKSLIGSNINVMSAKLKRSLLAKQQRDWDYGRINGKLDSKRLVRASQGFEAVYKKRIDRMEEDTAISILVDLSGSMSGRKAEVARDCALAIAECLEGSQMMFKVVGFCNKDTPKKAYEQYGKRGTMYHRYDRLDTVVFKDYTAPMRQCKYSIAQLPQAVGGSNSDYDFITNEISELKKRPEKRKVLFVLSDGHPACASDADTSEHVRHCNEAIKKAKRDGVECVGIGICDATVKKIYPDCVVVNDVNELSSTMFNKLTRMLV